MTERIESILKAVDFEAGRYHDASRALEQGDLAGRLYLNAKYSFRLVELIESAVEVVAEPIDDDEKRRAIILLAYIKGRFEGLRDVEEILNLTLRKKDKKTS